MFETRTGGSLTYERIRKETKRSSEVRNLLTLTFNHVKRETRTESLLNRYIYEPKENPTPFLDCHLLTFRLELEI